MSQPRIVLDVVCVWLEGDPARPFAWTPEVLMALEEIASQHGVPLVLAAPPRHAERISIALRAFGMTASVTTNAPAPERFAVHCTATDADAARAKAAGGVGISCGSDRLGPESARLGTLAMIRDRVAQNKSMADAARAGTRLAGSSVDVGPLPE